MRCFRSPMAVDAKLCEELLICQKPACGHYCEYTGCTCTSSSYEFIIVSHTPTSMSPGPLSSQKFVVARSRPSPPLAPLAPPWFMRCQSQPVSARPQLLYPRSPGRVSRILFLSVLSFPQPVDRTQNTDEVKKFAVLDEEDEFKSI